MTTKAELLQILSAHLGRDRGIGVVALARKAGIPERRVRRLVSELRLEGIGICGTPRSGYYIAVTPEELKETCAFLRRRALHSLKREARILNISLPDLMGQLLINQA